MRGCRCLGHAAQGPAGDAAHADDIAPIVGARELQVRQALGQRSRATLPTLLRHRQHRVVACIRAPVPDGRELAVEAQAVPRGQQQVQVDVFADLEIGVVEHLVAQHASPRHPGVREDEVVEAQQSVEVEVVHELQRTPLGDLGLQLALEAVVLVEQRAVFFLPHRAGERQVAIGIAAQQCHEAGDVVAEQLVVVVEQREQLGVHRAQPRPHGMAAHPIARDDPLAHEHEPARGTQALEPGAEAVDLGEAHKENADAPIALRRQRGRGTGHHRQRPRATADDHRDHRVIGLRGQRGAPGRLAGLHVLQQGAQQVLQRGPLAKRVVHAAGLALEQRGVGAVAGHDVGHLARHTLRARLRIDVMKIVAPQRREGLHALGDHRAARRAGLEDTHARRLLLDMLTLVQGQHDAVAVERLHQRASVEGNRAAVGLGQELPGLGRTVDVQIGGGGNGLQQPAVALAVPMGADIGQAQAAGVGQRQPGHRGRRVEVELADGTEVAQRKVQAAGHAARLGVDGHHEVPAADGPQPLFVGPVELRRAPEQADGEVVGGLGDELVRDNDAVGVERDRVVGGGHATGFVAQARQHRDAPLDEFPLRRMRQVRERIQQRNLHQPGPWWTDSTKAGSLQRPGRRHAAAGATAVHVPARHGHGGP